MVNAEAYAERGSPQVFQRGPVPAQMRVSYAAPVIDHPFRLVRELLYPERCVVCGRFGDVLCVGCREGLAVEQAQARCPNCSARWNGAGNCPRCFAWDALDGATAPHEMSGAPRRIIHSLKYGYVERLATVIAQDIARQADGSGFDVAFPVPLHRSRRRRRGFNQAELILGALGWPTLPGELSRTRNTETQVGKTARDRLRNVGGAFAYTGPSLAGLTVALVDDVVTTGATVNECARVLKDHGARRVVAFAFARASVELAHSDLPIRD